MIPTTEAEELSISMLTPSCHVCGLVHLGKHALAGAAANTGGSQAGYGNKETGRLGHKQTPAEYEKESGVVTRAYGW